jgi:2,3,4,5-tetrahydropyridine-2,6-dicarboxylate N-succinyltransferase
VTAGVKLALPDGRVVKARELSGQDNLLFRRNGLTGALEVVDRGGSGRSWTGLNTELHANV